MKEKDHHSTAPNIYEEARSLFHVSLVILKSVHVNKICANYNFHLSAVFTHFFHDEQHQVS